MWRLLQPATLGILRFIYDAIEHSRLTDGYDPIGIEPLEVRLAMLANGYEPIGQSRLPRCWSSAPVGRASILPGWR
jgi:hypothetical protein